MSQQALVTGGSTGIGQAIAEALQGAGFEVTLASRRNGWDLTDRDAIERLVASLDSLDLLVNNAGMAESAPLHKTTDELWNRHIALNVTAPFLLSRAALPLLRAAPQGRIINIASTAAIEGAAYIAAYAASKHALLGLSRSLAAELIDVKVHTVLPGYVDSPLTDRTVARIVEATGKSEDETRAFLGAQNESGKLITPAQVAGAVVQLLGEDETGQEVVLQ